MCINAVVVLEIANKVACELYIVGIASWTVYSYSSIPRGRIIDSLRENQNESSFVCFSTHICTLSCTKRCILIAVIVNDHRLWLSTVGWRQVNDKCTSESA